MTPLDKKMWAWPAVFGAMTAVGLLAALVGDGWWDWLSAVALGAPALACLWYGTRR